MPTIHLDDPMHIHYAKSGFQHGQDPKIPPAEGTAHFAYHMGFRIGRAVQQASQGGDAYIEAETEGELGHLTEALYAIGFEFFLHMESYQIFRMGNQDFELHF